MLNPYLFGLLALPSVALAFDSAVVFNEVHYHPGDEVNQTEWIEIKSNQGVDIDISGWSITGGANFTFPANTVLPGNGLLVIAKTPGQISGSLGPFTGNLSNSSETLRLRHRTGRIMDVLAYADDGGWPLAADGLGFTLSRRDSRFALPGPSAWAASSAPGGTPGTSNSVSPSSPSLVFNEIASALDPAFFIEIKNTSASPVSTAGWVLLTHTGQTVPLPGATIPAGGLAAFTGLELNLTPADNLRLTLASSNGQLLQDARTITNSLRGLTDAGFWGKPDSPTPGSANVVTVSDAIVINEIFYNGMNGSPEQWVELHNRSVSPVDVSGWNFSEGVAYTFPAATSIPAGGFAVVAWDPAAFATLHPGVTAFGPFSGSLSGKGETLSLSDDNGNIADTVRYTDGGLWSPWADGGGSSLELRDPDADNANPDAWDASDESTKTNWQTVTYIGTAANLPAMTLATWNELVFGMLDKGEVLIDDVSVKNVTQGNIELIQNGSFTGNADTWRIVGNHTGSVVPDPFSPGNSVLRLSAASATDSLDNQAQTTLKNGSSFHTIAPADTYSVSFRAKWLRGSPRLHSRLYVNRLARQTVLNVPATGGTPGAPNSRLAANIGPTLSGFGHSPVVPAANAAATVTVRAADPDGVASVLLFRSVNGAAFTSTAMADSNGVFTASLPGQAAGTIAQFYVQATDALGAVSYFPPEGPASRACVQWADGRALATLPSGAKPHNLRVIMPGADASRLYSLENLMSNADTPCTVVWNESVAYYRAGVQLKGSKHSRWNINRLGYNLSFPEDDLFLGVHGGLALDRSGDSNGAPGQKEILLKKLMNLAGGVAAPEDDLIRMIPAVATGTGHYFDGSAMLGASILSKTRLKDDFLAGQWEDGEKGMLFKYDAIYSYEYTMDPVTRIPDPTRVPENPKIPEGLNATGGKDGYSPSPFVNVESLGSDKENYRWNWIVENGRSSDDFTALINAVTAIGQAAGSAAFNSQTAQFVDVSAWLRATIPPSLFGIHDNYLGIVNNRHNAFVYIPPGGKATLFPWDMDYLNHGSGGSNATASLTNGGDLPKFLANPVYKRLYWGHMLDILNRSFNTATMTKWATHYSKFSSDDMVPMVSTFLTPRANHAFAQINAAIPQVAFSTTSPANNASVNAASTTVSGSGWVNVSEIRLAGSPEPLTVAWTGETTWTVSLPLRAGTHTYTLNAHGPDGSIVGTTSLTLTNTSPILPASAGLITVTEFNYNPAGTTDLEEFVALTNRSASTLDLSLCHFDETGQGGIAYTFPSGTQLAPGARLIVVRDRAAYEAFYGNTTDLAPGQWDAASALSNSGETLTLFAADGTLILSFAYDDDIAETDGGGFTMVRLLAPSTPDLFSYFWRSSSGAADIVPPAVVSLSPSANATGVPLNANLVLTFNELPALDTGNLTLRNLTDGTDTVIPVTDAAQVSLTGPTLTLNPSTNLLGPKTYALRIDPAAIRDLAGNPFAGIADDTTWSFSTEVPDTAAPTPNPLTWATPPTALSITSITMTATTASDPYGVEYYFTSLTPGGHDSGWQNSPTYVDTGLVPSTTYSYQVKARDKSSNANETTLSAPQAATTLTPDTAAPTPNPLTWATPPTALSNTSITMTATTASDPSGVEYYFDSLTPGGHDSGWQSSPTYVDTGLSASTSYSYQVRARDKAESPNEGAPSATVSATTLTPPAGNSVIYESFDYDAGTLNGKGGTTEVGLSGTWTATSAQVASTTLAYGSLPVFGRSIGNLPGGSNNFGGTRAISSSALSARGLLNDGSTLWFSVIVGYGTGGNLTNSRLAIALANSGFSTANFTYNILNESPQLGSGLGLTLGRFNGTNGIVAATQFTNSGSGFSGNVFGSLPSAFYTAGGQSGLIVGKFTWGAASDTLQLYRPGTDLALPATAFSTLTATVDQTTYDTITWSRGDIVVLDEIRFGANYHDVVGIPPTLISIADNKNGVPVAVGTAVSYTVTFSQDMDAATVSAADFGNAGTATTSIGSVTETTPGVFTFTATPTSTGTLRLQIKVGAELKNTLGNPLATTTAALLDDTTITVSATGVTLADFNNTHFTPAERANPLVSGPGADPDGDGVANLLEYALGTNPRDASLARLPAPVLASVSGQTHAALTFRRLQDMLDVTFVLEASTTAQNSGFAPVPATVTILTDHGDGTETVTLRETAPLPDGTATRFVRLRVIQN